jgi:hypothetical protein
MSTTDLLGLLPLLHGTFVDEVLIEIVLPLSIFGALYWWSSRKEKRKKKLKHDEVAAAEDKRP